MKNLLETHSEVDAQMQREEEARFFVSDLTEQARQNAKLMFGRNVRVEDTKFGE